MTDEQIILEFYRLLDPPAMKEQIESYKVIADAAIYIIHNEKLTSTNSEDIDANNLYQMTVLKCLSVLKHAEQKISYTNGISGFKLNIHDPFGLQPIVRAQFEAYGHFNNLYLQNNSQDEKKLKYDLWVMCGLINRQKFNVTSTENQGKKAKEFKEIEDLKNSIRNNSCFKMLNQTSQQQIFANAAKSDWKLTISGNKAVFIGWQQLVKNAGTNLSMDNLYRSFSLGAHPSNVSVFQFSHAYEKGHEHADFLNKLQLKLSKYFISFFIADYCHHSPNAKVTFDEMPALHQLLVNAYNKMFRENKYQVNDIWNRFNTILVDNIRKGKVL